MSSHKGRRPNSGLLDEDSGPPCAGTGAGAQLPASDSRNQSTSLLTVGRILSFQVGPMLGQMRTQTRNIFLLPSPSPEFCWGPVHRKSVNWNCPCCPSEKWDVVHHVPWRKTPICSLQEDNYVYKLPTFSSLPSPAVGGAVLMMKIPE